MKILAVLPHSVEVGPRWQSMGLVVAAFTLGRGLVKRGHQIDYLGNFTVSVENESGGRQLSFRSVDSREQLALIERALELSRNYDVILFHSNLYLAQALAEYLDFIEDSETRFRATLHSSCPGGKSINDCKRRFLALFFERRKLKLCFPSKEMVYQFKRALRVNEEPTPDAIIGNPTWTDRSLRSVERSDVLLVATRIESTKETLRSLTKAMDSAKKHGLRVVFVGHPLSTHPKSVTYREFLKSVNEFLRQNKIEHFDYLDHHDLLVLMAKSRAVIHLSEFESWGLVATEAMSVGTPVVAMNHWGNPLKRLIGPAGVALTKRELNRCEDVYALVKDIPREVVTNHFDSNFDENGIFESYEHFLS